MKDRLKYVIDSRYFDGTCLTSMSDGFHNDYGGETIEELRIRENNPYLKAVTPSDIDKKLRLYHKSLSEPFKEITEEDYYDLLDVLPPLRMRQNSFFVGEPYYGNMYSFCFTRQSVLTPQSELDSQIDRHMEIINRKAVISKEETSKTVTTGTRLIPYYFSLDGKQSVFICNLVIQSDSRQARTDMANTLKSLRRNHYQFRTLRNSGRTDRPCIRKEAHSCFRRTFLSISSRQGIRNFHRTHQGNIRGISFSDL